MPYVSVNPTNTLGMAIEKMTRARAHRLWITDHNNVPHGVLTEMDILKNLFPESLLKTILETRAPLSPPKSALMLPENLMRPALTEVSSSPPMLTYQKYRAYGVTTARAEGKQSAVCHRAPWTKPGREHPAPLPASARVWLAGEGKQARCLPVDPKRDSGVCNSNRPP